ncbi:flagellar basal-body rod protein FlgF [Maridesulfovibrio frigidus]|uniref:flagellar basal-body rod protein FlgF n=1 Tax=Maridesulfovibrio frigidus TaxID=340956 RepID=UPI0004E18D3A|nr:flagellar basal-body rod protein FlgF [Maridesulfovibrio frigidus]
MQTSIYSALFGAMSNEHRVSISANNLANVNTTGFKRDTCAFEDTFVKFAHDYVVDAKPFIRDKNMFPKPRLMARPRLSEEVIDMAQGSLQKTDNSLDVAIRGDGFFKVQKDGGEFYTRNGVFTLSPEGNLITEQGYPVLAAGGPVLIPPRAEVTIDEGGFIRANDQELAQLDYVQAVDPRTVKKEGENLYSIEGEVVPGTGDILQGYIEKSNVEVINEMVAMIESQRSFEMYQKMITSTDDLDTKVIQKVGQTT